MTEKQIRKAIEQSEKAFENIIKNWGKLKKAIKKGEKKNGKLG